MTTQRPWHRRLARPAPGTVTSGTPRNRHSAAAAIRIAFFYGASQPSSIAAQGRPGSFYAARDVGVTADPTRSSNGNCLVRRKRLRNVGAVGTDQSGSGGFTNLWSGATCRHTTLPKCRLQRLLPAGHANNNRLFNSRTSGLFVPGIATISVAAVRRLGFAVNPIAAKELVSQPTPNRCDEIRSGKFRTAITADPAIRSTTLYAQVAFGWRVRRRFGHRDFIYAAPSPDACCHLQRRRHLDRNHDRQRQHSRRQCSPTSNRRRKP